MTTVIQIEIRITRPIVNKTERNFFPLPPISIEIAAAGPIHTSSADTYIDQAFDMDFLLPRFR